MIAASADTEKTARHECFHHWLGPLLSNLRAPMVTVRGHSRVVRIAREEAWAALPQVEAADAREERIVQALTELTTR